MKKTYMQPAMLVVKTNAAKMICNSDPKVMLGDGQVTTKSSGNFSKRRGIFQDDSEEDQSIW